MKLQAVETGDTDQTVHPVIQAVSHSQRVPQVFKGSSIPLPPPQSLKKKRRGRGFLRKGEMGKEGENGSDYFSKEKIEFIRVSPQDILFII